MTEKILILDFGSQYTQLIARRTRELNVYSEIVPFNKIPKIDDSIKAIILSGSPFSVLEKDALQVELDKIYFDFDKSNIRKDAAVTLNVLVDLMKKYPSMEIEVSAHTDARGKDQYNLDLSKQRAASTLEYLVSQGIDRNRLKSIGYGEMQPLNNCDNDSKCNEKDYDINRRCEFTILN